jgi:hypothetical protein
MHLLRRREQRGAGQWRRTNGGFHLLHLVIIRRIPLGLVIRLVGVGVLAIRYVIRCHGGGGGGGGGLSRGHHHFGLSPLASAKDGPNTDGRATRQGQSLEAFGRRALDEATEVAAGAIFRLHSCRSQ